MNDTNRNDDNATGLVALDREEVYTEFFRLEKVAGSMNLGLEIEFKNGGEHIVTFTRPGYSDEAGEFGFHAVYDNLAEVANVLNMLDELDAVDLADEMENLELEYQHRVALGWGEWIRGDNIMAAYKRADAKIAAGLA